MLVLTVLAVLNSDYADCAGNILAQLTVLVNESSLNTVANWCCNAGSVASW